MGLMALDEAEWIDPDADFVTELSEKERLLADPSADVVRMRQGSEAAQREVLERLVRHVTCRFPRVLEQDGDRLLVKPVERRYRMADWSDRSIDLAGRLVQEDFCLMAPGEAGYTLEAASVCFPARWRLADKIGRPMSVIHEPVPGFRDRLARPVDRFFDRLRVDHPVWRVNWSLGDDPALYQPVRRRDTTANPGIDRTNVGSRVFVRCERQSLHRLRESGWILFTIRTHIDPLAALEAYPEAAAGLAAALRTVPHGMRRYKNLAPFESVVLAFLDDVGASSGPAG